MTMGRIDLAGPIPQDVQESWDVLARNPAQVRGWAVVGFTMSLTCIGVAFLAARLWVCLRLQKKLSLSDYLALLGGVMFNLFRGRVSLANSPAWLTCHVSSYVLLSVGLSYIILSFANFSQSPSEGASIIITTIWTPLSEYMSFRYVHPYCQRRL